MKNTFPVVDAITAAVAALPFRAKIHALSVSLQADGAIVPVQRERGDFASYEWARVNPAQLYWGRYDLNQSDANEDHAKRFARLTGVRS